MSSSAPGGASTPKEKKGFGKVFSRVKTVLKRGDSSSKRQSTISTAQSTPATKKEPVKERYVDNHMVDDPISLDQHEHVD